MTRYSVSDQFCNFETGNWHQRIYMSTDTCQTGGWWYWYNPVELTYTTDSCIAGFRLKECSSDPCPETNDSMMDTVNMDRFVDSMSLDGSGKKHSSESQRILSKTDRKIRQNMRRWEIARQIK